MTAPGPATDVAWHGLAPAAKTFWTITALVPLAVFAAIGVAVGVAVDSNGLVVGIVGASLVLAGWFRWLVGRRYAAWRYSERSHDLVLERGVLFRRVTVVPYGRMQFVDVAQGPLDRWLGLATVTLHTAAAATDATIPLLTTTAAERLRDRLLQRGDVDAAGL